MCGRNHGVLQLMLVKRATSDPGDKSCARSRPKRRRQVKVAETQAKDVVIGQKAIVDTRNGVNGHVSRVDPSVVNGTVR
jgi:HlyD family secretion protein